MMKRSIYKTSSSVTQLFAGERAICVALMLILLAGCGGSQSSGSTGESRHVRLLVGLYKMAARERGRPLTNDQDFKDYVNSRGPEWFKEVGVSDVDELFTSERDGQPIVVVYGERPAGMAKDVIAYEQTGVDGKRMVGFDLGNVEEVDETRFRELVPASAAAPPKT